MKIQDDYPIDNTLNLRSNAIKGVIVRSVEELKRLVKLSAFKDHASVALGMGSNVIAMPVVNKLVISIRISGTAILKEDGDFVWVRCGAGENWDTFVRSLLAKGLFGLENLVLIPGLVGSAPIQNIGAYGTEVSEFVESVEVVNEAGVVSILDNTDCEFGYRNSLFKKNSEFVVTAVCFKLRKKARVRIDYPDLRDFFADLKKRNPTPLEIADAVTQIRTQKLPDPKKHPNVGSFFKNPLVNEKKAGQLQARYPMLKTYRSKNGIKLSAAQLIDLEGWKERPSATVACWKNQPLVLVNQNQGTVTDLLGFAEDIARSIERRYDVSLELEPSILS